VRRPALKRISAAGWCTVVASGAGLPLVLLRDPAGRGRACLAGLVCSA